MSQSLSDDMKSLVSLALLESQYDLGKPRSGSFDLLMPLVTDSLHGLSEDVTFDVEDMAGRIERRSGLPLPLPVVKGLLDRCCGTRRNPGYVKHLYERYQRTKVPIEYSEMASRKQRIEEDHAELVYRMIAYAERNGIPGVDAYRAGGLLSEYLDENFRSLAVRDVPDDSADARHSPARWIGRFLLELNEVDGRLFDAVVVLVRGRVIYDAAFAAGFASDDSRLEGLVAYLDSSVVCRAMGLGTDVDERFVREALDLLRGAGVTCEVLEQTASEIGRIMSYVSDHWLKSSGNEPPDHFVFTMPERGWPRSKAERLSSDPVSEIEGAGLGLSVVPSPPRIPFSTSDEAALTRRLQRSPDDPRGRTFDSNRVQHDVDCVAAVLTGRGEHQALSLSKVTHLFLVESPRTIRNIRFWWDKDMGRSDIPPVMSLTDLANMSWLYANPKESRAFSKESLMSVCAASAMPSEQVWTAFNSKLTYLVRTERMTPERARDILFNRSAKLVLSHIDDASVREGFDDERMESVVDDIERHVADEVYGEAMEEANERLRRSEEEVESLKTERRNDQDRLERARADQRRASEERARLDRSIHERCSRRARACMRVLRAVCWGIVAIIFIYYCRTRQIENLLGWVGAALSIGVDVFLGKFDAEEKMARRFEDRERRSLLGEGPA